MERTIVEVVEVASAADSKPASTHCPDPRMDGRRRALAFVVQVLGVARRLDVVFGDVVDSRARHEASDRGVRTSVIVEVDEASEGVESVAV